MHLSRYLDKLKQNGKEELASAVGNTVSEIIPKYIRTFSFNEHITGLLMGHVQSGKTSHMFGIIAASADEGFNIFVLLTTDNIYLHKQTIERATRELDSFNICGEDDEIKFVSNKLKKPSLIILKKNSSILKRWRGNFSSSGFCLGNPLFIIDDEGDAASLNTLVNKKRISTINKHLDALKRLSSSSIYLQVTGTPQALLLQTIESGWKPRFVYYFKPGKNYLGGDFFFSQPPVSSAIFLTDDKEINDLLNDDEFAVNGLKRALLSFLTASAHIFYTKMDNVCNFLIHPSFKIDTHEKIAEKVGDYLNTMLLDINESQLEEQLRESYEDLKKTKSDLIDFNKVIAFVKDVLENDRISIKVMNSLSSITDYDKGLNIIVGGNSLGRGITFPRLQTIYYCRRAKTPQADTAWQHSRMFGYDRDKDLIRVYMPPTLYKVFTDLNNTNNSLIAQIKKYGIDNIRLYYPAGIKPTRSQVLNKSSLSVIAGGVNYFPFEPTNISIETLDDMLKPFGDEGYYTINLKLMIKYLEQIKNNDSNDWDNNVFINCINSYIADKPGEQGVLIVRRERDIAKGTGTLLSPNDRALGKSFADRIVLTLYKVTGNKGWNNQKLWVPNIKFPDNICFYNMDK